MKCPYCERPETKVLDKRETDAGHITRRRRECLSCAKRFTTYERAEVLNLFIIKKDKRREAFDRQKLKRNLMKACEKRPISHEAIDHLIANIDQELINMRKSEIESRLLGELVMAALKDFDKVAYIRFASVYRDFKDVEDFEKGLRELVENEKTKETDNLS